jgi:periplasmic protein CpxP/Spy
MMSRRLFRNILAVALVTGGLARADAQVRMPPERRQQQAAPRRQQLEQQLRRRLWSVTKERVGLTDAQMTQLGQTTQKFDVRRRSVNQDERAQRMELRNQILAGDKADQSRIAAALDRLQQLQRQRLDIQGEEQAELAKFMSPLQRARYVALQEQVRRRVEALRRERPDSTRLGDSLGVSRPSPSPR